LKTAEALNRPLEEIFPSLPENESNSPTERSEFSYKRGDGKTLILGYSRSPLKSERGEEIGKIILIRDLTELRQMQEAAEKNSRLAFIGQMAANLAHEFRNPLMSISGSIQMLKRSLPLKEEEMRLMDIIMRARDRLEAVIRDFLLLSRRIKREVEDFNVSHLTQEIVERLKQEVPEAKKVNFLIDTWPDTIFTGNREEVRHLLYNLLLNAVQAVSEEGLVKVKSKKYTTGEECGIEMVVEDNGSGITPEEKNLIFEPFYTTKEKGTGLGLSIVSTIVQTYGGTIEVESTPGEKTRFTVRLPYYQKSEGD